MTHQILWPDVRGTDFETPPGSRACTKNWRMDAKMKGIFFAVFASVPHVNYTIFSLPFTFQLWRHGQLPGPALVACELSTFTQHPGVLTGPASYSKCTK
ncbi:hypothetical protein AVEN_263623-1 [Araneus ventricosus]|uniref:Uncharacterized protein n=1 Tax=Araneus ventricosus TaxID=182803 RepID=A0A4Y2ATR2_ARAVE|nr:hypothetical protein AVEN_263623-1 [Araneus ventricosus]